MIIRTLLLAVIVLMSGCASIVSKNVYPVNISSTPNGATFTVTDRNGLQVQRGTTPQVIQLKASSGYFKGQKYEILVSKEGFEDQSYTLSSSVDGWYWGNILIGGLIGMLAVDPATGAMYKLPDSVDVTLSDARISNNDDDFDIVIASIDSLSIEQQSRLVPIGTD